MPAFELKIEQDEIAPGVPSTSSIYTADRGLSRTSTHRVLTSKFGDGYEQRVLDGINTKNDEFQISFNNRSASSINLLAKYLDSKAGKNFVFTVTDYDGDTQLKVVCESYNTVYLQENTHSLTTTFRRVYEP